MALCPQCDHSVLVHTMLTDNLAGYSCGKCLGTLVSLVAYRAWREHGRGARFAEPRPPRTPTPTPPDSIGAKKCPKCRSVMSKYRISAGQDPIASTTARIARRSGSTMANGSWSRAWSLAGDFTKVFTQAWQYAVRVGRHGRDGGAAAARNTGRRLRTRGRSSREWLQTQPAKQEILAG